MNLFQATIQKRYKHPKRCGTRLLPSIKLAQKTLESQTELELAATYQDLRAQNEFKDVATKPSNEIIVQSFAIGIEALRRTTGMVAYDVQILAGLAMASGSIAEMQTGEGKTLTTMLPIVVLALPQRGVHVATVNAYLAQRDYEFLKPGLEMLGITTGISLSGASPEEKRSAYACDVTFGTGYEFGFDFLRDQIATKELGTDRLGAKLRQSLLLEPKTHDTQTQRGFAVAIVDEIDSVFIDEATTPLVLSSGSLGTNVDDAMYLQAKTTVESLVENEDFIIDRLNKTLSLTERGVESAQQARGLFVKSGKSRSLLRPWQQYVESALRARYMMNRDINYVVRDEKVEIVDEYTGRIFSDRSWRDGLHQAVEAKENVPITEERRTIARISRQRYFQRYELLCGMTGTADGHQREFQKCYNLPVVVVPRRKKLRRIELPTRYFRSQDDKSDAIVKDAIARSLKGQPILIGTRTIQQSWQLSEKLDKNAIQHRILNGVQDEEEAALIATAGTSGAITVATNMAGRGTDIQLDSQAIEAGGLHVIGFERNSSPRIDRQLLGRSGRQGDPGSGQFFVSAEDQIINRFDSTLVKLLKRITKANGVQSQRFDRRVILIQRASEQTGYSARQEVMREELWLDKVKKSAG